MNGVVVHTIFMNHGDKTNLVYGIIDVFLPKVRCLWMALHRVLHRDDMSLWYGFVTAFIPPVLECTVRSEEEALFWWGGLTKCSTNIRTMDNQVFDCCNTIKQYATGVVDTVRICVIKDMNLSCTRRSITRTSCLLVTVFNFDVIGPH